ncbi:MAG TPA: replicative DNA helicase [Candidatus Hydrogenedentes bacterium]|nr:replicative DNA helicase [Candidatus Hydrogenedentota bacterium]HOV73038.1 replicative DNA helicase [Candidatus Hydrogenedentota bacterium]HPC14786.1 replicative DNA helicase [Candidatus Hydrogenedentota bacterium]HRT18650.1 replicative DNA helicase [Candidatus Hydrogenedentota bacterium]HRT63670.1 replicative DNA helicase [Candidatus Hydrogenedentota bacterium]
MPDTPRKKPSRKAGHNAQPVFERVPPQNVDAERAVLGAMLLDADAAGAINEILRDDGSVFYVEAHQHIYNAAVSLMNKNAPVDPVTVYQQLSDDGHLDAVGGGAYLGELTSVTPTSANADYYANVILELALQRRLILECNTIAGQAYEFSGKVSELLDDAEAAIFSIAQKRQTNPIQKIGALINDSVEEIERIVKQQTGIRGLPTGVKKLDECLSGLQPSDMIVLAARPSVGKTAFALNIAAHVAVRERKGVLIFSLEMAKEQLTQRLLCMQGHINSARLRTGYLAKDELPKLIRAAGELNDAPIYIDETPNIRMLEIRSKARRHMSQNPCHLVIIDYMQLMSGDRRAENRQVEISEISRGIKGLARELKVPILALSQLSREAERDDTGTPKLSHLRESGSIEQDADVVMFLYRPPEGKTPQAENLIKLQVAKHRNGPTDKFDLLFLKDYQRFENIAKDVDEPSAAAAEDDSFEDETPF